MLESPPHEHNGRGQSQGIPQKTALSMGLGNGRETDSYLILDM